MVVVVAREDKEVVRAGVRSSSIGTGVFLSITIACTSKASIAYSGVNGTRRTELSEQMRCVMYIRYYMYVYVEQSSYSTDFLFAVCQ